MTVETIKATVTYQAPPVRTRRDLPIVDPDRLTDDAYRSELLEVLAACEAWEDTEVVVQARHLSLGFTARKPSGEYVYTRINTEWLYAQLGVTTERVLCVGDGGTVQLWEPDALVVTTLSYAVRGDEDFLYTLMDMVSPE